MRETTNGSVKESEQSNVAVASVSERTDKTKKIWNQDGEVECGTKTHRKKESRKERRKKSREVDIPDDGVPYDKGWAWMIVLAGFMNFVMAAGYNRGTFIFFVSFLEEFQAPVTETALLFGVKAAINSVVGLFIMNAVVGRFGVRKTVFLGGICISLSAILGSFATDIPSLVLSQSVFHGLGMSMLNMPTTVLLGFYFRRRRSLANSITKCGVGVGAVAFPPIVTFILRLYGLRGALLLMGAVCLNTLVAAMLLRPTSFYKKRKQQCLEEECSGKLMSSENSTTNRGDGGGEDKIMNMEPDEQKADTDLTSDKNDNFRRSECADDNPNSNVTDYIDNLQMRGTDHRHTGEESASTAVGDSCVVVIEQEVVLTSGSISGRTQGQTTLSPLSYQLLDTSDISKSAPDLNSVAANSFRRRASTFFNHKTVSLSKNVNAGKSGHVLDALSQSNVVRFLSMPDLELDTPCVVTSADHVKDTPLTDSLTPRTCLSTARHVAGKVLGVLDFRLFHSPMFRLLVVFYVASPMTGAVITYLPAMATQRGLDEQQRAILLSIIGGLDFCCRLTCGFVADLKIMKVSTMIGVAFIILGAVCQLTRLMTTFPLLIGLAVAQGMLGGVAACMMPILIMEDIGLENTAKALGFNKLFSGAAMAAFHPFLGYIRDSTGSYDAAYNVIGGFTLLSAAVILCLRFLPHTLPPSRDSDALESEESSPLSHKTDDREMKS